MQQQGKANTARLGSEIRSRSLVWYDLGAKQFVLRAVLHDIGRDRFDSQRSFFSCDFKAGSRRLRMLRG